MIKFEKKINVIFLIRITNYICSEIIKYNKKDTYE